MGCQESKEEDDTPKPQPQDPPIETSEEEDHVGHVPDDADDPEDTGDINDADEEIVISRQHRILFSLEAAPDDLEFRPDRVSKGAIHAPTRYEGRTFPLEAPGEDLELSFVHGYRGKDCRVNAHFLASGEVVYHIAALGIVVSPAGRAQRYYRGHNDDILCLAVHPDGTLVATGEIGRDPPILVWDTLSMQTEMEFRGQHSHGVAALAFSPDGALLVSAGLDDQHRIVVWSTKQRAALCSINGSRSKLLAFAFSSPREFVAIGVRAIEFCRFEGSTIVKRRGIFGQRGTYQTLPCAAYLPNGLLITGTQRGDLYLWRNRKLVGVRPDAHKGRVTALAVLPDRSLLSAGADGALVHWALRPRLTRIGSVQLPSEFAGAPKALEERGGQLLVGTACNILGTVALGSDASSLLGRAEVLTAGHCDEVWGLATHPRLPIALTAADDATLRMWDLSQQLQVATTPLSGPARAVAISPDTKWVAVGTQEGKIEIFDFASLTRRQIIQNRTRAIAVLRFNPASTRLAAGTHESEVDIIDVGSFARVGVLRGHSSFVNHLDWSADGRYLQTNCGAYEILFWDAQQCEQITASSTLRDTEWATWTCKIGWPVQGIWPKFSDGSDINALDVSPDRRLLVLGDDSRRVGLMSFPCLDPQSEKKYARGHSEHVTSAAFTADGRTVLSTGGLDASVLVWHVTEPEAL
eukprot:gnl/Trimastix_PCT/2281.p1 GENE.gnl/Trimastix_PCT/2281~~gnl/Trimastix_PCT/2281.p1  ORF type:complete len:694 (-),score=216.07 gnl/Trimastix_PCT/2281:691-2772(-)